MPIFLTIRFIPLLHPLTFSSTASANGPFIALLHVVPVLWVTELCASVVCRIIFYSCHIVMFPFNAYLLFLTTCIADFESGEIKQRRYRSDMVCFTINFPAI